GWRPGGCTLGLCRKARTAMWADHQFDHQTGGPLARAADLYGTERVLWNCESTSGAHYERSTISLAGKGSAVRIRHAPPLCLNSDLQLTAAESPHSQRFT